MRRLGTIENPCRNNNEIYKIIRGMGNCNIYTLDTFEISEENLKLDNIWFSQRKELENKYKERVKENKVADSIFNVISFLEAYNLLNRRNVDKFLKEKKNENKF